MSILKYMIGNGKVANILRGVLSVIFAYVFMFSPYINTAISANAEGPTDGSVLLSGKELNSILIYYQPQRIYFGKLDAFQEENIKYICPVDKDKSDTIKLYSMDRNLYILSDFDNIYMNPDASNMFKQLFTLNEVSFGNLLTNYTTNMSGMFSGCVELESIDLTNFDTSSVRNMESMFYCCRRINEIDVSSFNVTKVSNFGNMFAWDWSLETIYASTDWVPKILSPCNSMGMFNSCFNLVGGGGTKNEDCFYSRGIVYAKIDNPKEKKYGYFTKKP